MVLLPPFLTLSDIKYISRVKWRNTGKGVAPSLHFSVVAIEKGAFWSPSTKGRQIYFYLFTLLLENKGIYIVA